jgi:M6 family metalloprotease-like protein
MRSRTKTMATWALLLCALSGATTIAAPPARPHVLLGRLELQWGDPRIEPHRAHAAGRFNATLLADDGRRYRLDPAQAKRAAGDLYVLMDRRVAVRFADAPRANTSAFAPSPSGDAAIEAIVPADRWSESYGAVGADGRAIAQNVVLGSTRWVTVACRFSDIATEQKPVSFFQSQYGTQPGQLGHYWKEVSYDKIDLTGSTAKGWYALPFPRSHYVTVVDGKDKADLNALFSDCGAVADPDVDFLNVQGVNMMFNGDLDGFAWGGGSCATLDGQRVCPRVTWNPPWSFNNLAPLAHEMGHGYGLPHSDNSDGDDDTYDNPWDVMSDAWDNAVSDATFGALPKHINIFQRDRLGWVDAARKLTIPAGNAQRRQIKLDFASTRGSTNTQMIVLAMPAQADPAATVIYTLEARGRGGNYESNLAGNAVIVHRVEDYGTAYSVDSDVPPADTSNNEGSMLKSGERWRTPDGGHWVHVDTATSSGFLVTIGPKPIITGGPAPKRRVPAALSLRARAATTR